MIIEISVLTAYVTEKLIRFADQVEDGEMHKDMTNTDMSLDNLWNKFKEYVDQQIDRG